MKEPIVQEGDPILRKKAKPVAVKDIGSKKIADVIKRMKNALANEDFGVAIAAPQIGEPLRIFVIAGKAFLSDEETKGFDEEEKAKLPDLVFINPELLRVSKKVREMSEGCLSVRSKYGTVMRHEKAAVKAIDEHGKAFTYQGAGLIGHIFQHEMDHLEGILYVDKTVALEEDEDLKGARKKVREKHGL